MAPTLSIWEKETFFAPQDVVIVGSGFVGLWSAYYLKKKNPSARITVLDRGFIPTGASTRNAGFACFGSLSELVWDAQTMGTEKMLQVTEMRFKGLERIRKVFGQAAIDFSPCGGYELYAAEAISTATLRSNLDYLNSLLRPVTGSKKTYRFADEKISGFGFGRTAHLVETKGEGCLHPGKLLQALLQKVQGLGVTVLNRMEITGLHDRGESIELQTAQAPSFRAAQVLLCTNAFTRDLLPDFDVVPARGQVLLTSPIPGLPFRGTFHAEEGFFYFRNLGNRVLLGGARHRAFAAEATTDMHTTDFIQKALEDYLAEVVLPGFRGQYTIEHRWAGIMGFGSEKMPVVKQLTDKLFCAVRMNGMGVALAPVVARQIAEMMRD